MVSGKRAAVTAGVSKIPAQTLGVDSARRALQVLLLFSGDRPRLSVEEVASAIGVSVPSAYRFISLLREMSLVDESGPALYSLTPRVFALTRAAENALQASALFHPLVERLATTTAEASLVIRRTGDFAICAAIKQTDAPIRLSFSPGEVMSLHRGAAPKVLLAYMGAEWASTYFDRIDDPRLPKSERDAILAELPKIRARGWSKSYGEIDEGVWAIAAPIKAGEKVIAAVTVAGPHFRIGAKTAQRIQDEVIKEAFEVSRELGFAPDDGSSA